jgi:hypothetical protein
MKTVSRPSRFMSSFERTDFWSKYYSHALNHQNTSRLQIKSITCAKHWSCADNMQLGEVFETLKNQSIYS